MTLKNNRAPLLCCLKLYALFHSHQGIQTNATVRERSIWVKIGDFVSRVTLKFDRWLWKTIGHLFYATLSFVHHFLDIGEFKLELQSGNAQFESKSTIFLAVWPWNLTDDLEKQLGTSPLRNINLYASFHHHMWIQTGVTVQKRLSWVMTSVTLTFELWPWPFAWTSLLSLVITLKNFVMIRWWEHSKKDVTYRQTDGRTDGQTAGTIHRATWSQLKELNTSSTFSPMAYINISTWWSSVSSINMEEVRNQLNRFTHVGQ